jgi:multidrug resistance efflux pump
MKTFYGICITAVLVIIVITMMLRRESSSFYGIADAQEIAINDEFAVEISKIHVVPGQQINSGDTLLEVKTPELDLKIAEINRDLGALKMQTSAHAKLSSSELQQLKSEQAVRVNALRGEISELEAQLENNRKLMSELRSIKKGENDSEKLDELSNPIAVRIQQLKRALDLALDSSKISEKRLSNEMLYQSEPLAERAKGLQKELDILFKAKQQSAKISPITGIVGVICFKEGEKVPPFTPICSLHTESPSFIRGYIHENAYSQVAVGQKVRVSSLANKQTFVAGEVIGVGSRIVEYPIRLRKNPEMLMWGREVTIRIPEVNKFLLGEKVMISIIDHPTTVIGDLGELSILGSVVYAAGTTVPGTSLRKDGLLMFTDIVPAEKANIASRIEASGALYLEDIDKYLVISDDTEKKTPSLFIMNSAGKIEKETVIAGVQAINDMEGVAPGDDGSVYILTSQSRNKKGNLPSERKLFLWLARNGERFALKGSIQLSDVLLAAAQKKPDQAWAKYLSKAIGDSTLDIEGVAFRKGELFLGIKSPLLDECAVVLNIGRADKLFDTTSFTALNIAIWRQWKLIDPATGAPAGISDLHFAGDVLYALAVAETRINDSPKTSGALWLYRIGDKQPVCNQHYSGLKPEGIAFNRRTGELLVTFDNGSKRPSQMIVIKVEK